MEHNPPAQSSMNLVYYDRRWEAGPRDDDCGICIQPFHSWQTTITHTKNKCNRTFHTSCLQKWLINGQTRMDSIKTCPFCRGFIAFPSLPDFELIGPSGDRELVQTVYMNMPAPPGYRDVRMPVRSQNRPGVLTADDAGRRHQLIGQAVRELRGRGR